MFDESFHGNELFLSCKHGNPIYKLDHDDHETEPASHLSEGWLLMHVTLELPLS